MTEKNRFQKGKIYTIRYRLDNSLIYVGSTTQTLCKRWGDHKSAYTTYQDKYDFLLYQKIKETSDLQNWYIELYELFPCNSKMELEKREGEIIREIGTLNLRIAGRTKKERYDDNFQTISMHKAEKILCECGKHVSRTNIAKHQKTERHKEKLGLITLQLNNL